MSTEITVRDERLERLSKTYIGCKLTKTDAIDILNCINHVPYDMKRGEWEQRLEKLYTKLFNEIKDD